MFSSFWRMRRAQRLEQSLFEIVMTEQEWWSRSLDGFSPSQDEARKKRVEELEVDLDQGLNRAAKAFKGESAVFHTLSQYEARLSRQYLRYRKELRALQAQDKANGAETQSPPPPLGKVGNPLPVGPTGQAPQSAPPNPTPSAPKPSAPASTPSSNLNKSSNIRVIGFVPPQTPNFAPQVTPKAKKTQPKNRGGRR
jgi:hypothetical protein